MSLPSTTQGTHARLTERQVDHDVMRPKVRRHIARRAREIRKWRPPVIGVNAPRPVQHVTRDRPAVTRPEPHLHTCVRALHCVEAASRCVERGPVRGRVVGRHAAATVAGRVDITVVASRCASHGAGAPDRAACEGRRSRHQLSGREEFGRGCTYRKWCGAWPGRFRGRSRLRGCRSLLLGKNRPRAQW